MAEKGDNGIKMIAAASDALSFKRGHPEYGHPQILRHVFSLASREKDKEAKIGMVAAASKALDLLERNPSLRDKEILRVIMDDLSAMQNAITSSDNFPFSEKDFE